MAGPSFGGYCAFAVSGVWVVAKDPHSGRPPRGQGHWCWSLELRNTNPGSAPWRFAALSAVNSGAELRGFGLCCASSRRQNPGLWLTAGSRWWVSRKCSSELSNTAEVSRASQAVGWNLVSGLGNWRDLNFGDLGCKILPGLFFFVFFSFFLDTFFDSSFPEVGETRKREVK